MKQSVIFFLLLITIGSHLSAQKVEFDQACKVAENKLILMGKSHTHIVGEACASISQKQSEVLYYAFNLKPKGYIVICSRTDLPPVIAYSFTNNFGNESSAKNPLMDLLETDLKARIASIDLLDKTIVRKRQQMWEQLLKGIDDTRYMLEYWPAEGTTSSGGWIESNWKQDGFYDNFCPIDPVTNQRSLVGCPATTMGMLLEFYQTVNETEFTQEDAYYHSYSGRNYQIDGDFEEHDFLSFPMINEYLTSISSKFENNDNLNNDEKAALSFACGVAATHVYTSEGSGTFGVNQALEAYQKFGFSEAQLLENGNPEIYARMSENIKEARPVHLAVVNESWTSGHNVVVDGYNTDDYYHVNFGWGGYSNGWYLLPEQFPYSLTVIEGVVVDIAYPPYGTSVSNIDEDKKLDVSVFPNPASDFVQIAVETSIAKQINLSIVDIYGHTLYSEKHAVSGKEHEFTLDLNLCTGQKLIAGIYFLKVETESNAVTNKVIIQ